MVPTMNSKEILWPDKQLTDQIQKAKEIQRRTLSRRPLWSERVKRAHIVSEKVEISRQTNLTHPYMIKLNRSHWLNLVTLKFCEKVVDKGQIGQCDRNLIILL